MSNHVPRRSGAGMRQAIVPKIQRPKRRRRVATGTLCNAVHPERTGARTLAGETIDAVTCTRPIETKLGRRGLPEYVPHTGEHRARVLAGHVERWADEQ